MISVANPDVAACASAGFEPRVVQRAGRMTTAVSPVASGIGIAILPVTATRIGIDGVIFRPLDPSYVKIPVAFVWRRGQTLPVLPPFMAAVRESALVQQRKVSRPRNGSTSAPKLR